MVGETAAGLMSQNLNDTRTAPGMTLINLPLDEARAISAVDDKALDAAIDKCLREERLGPIYELHLSECGSYIASELRTFERAMTAFSNAKAHSKREETRVDAIRAGSDLSDAVMLVKGRLETEREDRSLFYIDDQIISPLRLTNRLKVSVRYGWRASLEAEWTHGQTMFTYDYSPTPDYAQFPPKRKPSAAKAASDLQTELQRQWDNLQMQALCSVRDFFRNGGEGGDIPEVFAVRPDPYGGGLNNFSCRFWQPA